jgi:hypothetical protein
MPDDSMLIRGSQGLLFCNACVQNRADLQFKQAWRNPLNPQKEIAIMQRHRVMPHLPLGKASQQRWQPERHSMVCHHEERLGPV